MLLHDAGGAPLALLDVLQLVRAALGHAGEHNNST